MKGNRLRLAIPLQTVTVTEHGTVTADYNVPAGAEVTVTLTGTWKTYKYVPEVNGNLLTITDEGTLPAGTYAVETTVVQADGEHLRSKYCNMVEISDCNDGVTQEYDDFISGSVTLEEQIFYFAKGDKGDAFTYEDFTEEQIANLQRPATEAAAALNETEQQRVANERARQTAESARERHEGNRILAEETREGNEQTREMAEVERQRNTQQAIAAANNAAAAANNAAANAKADYVGSDNYVYHWDEATQEYVKTNLYVKGADGQDGEKGDPGTTDYNDLQNKPDLSGFITISVNNLVNYYLKSETYTKQEVQALIAAIQQFHYEIYASTSDVTSPQGNVLYLIGPTGTGADKYEEYVYDSTKQEPWVKIGDTSIDLSDYYTKGQTDNAIMSALNTALASYTTTAALTLLLAGKQDVINDLSDIRSGARAGATAYQKPQGGIPSTDMSQGVQTSLGKADSSLQPTQQTLTDAQKQQARNNIGAAGVDDVPTLPNNVSYFSGDSGDGIVPTDGIRGEDIVASSAISVNPDVVTAITGEIGSATTITLVAPNDSLRHVWDMFFTTASDGGATIVVPQGATLHVPSGYSIASGKTYEVRVIGVGNHYYLTCQEYN